MSASPVPAHRARIRPATPDDTAAAYRVCLETGNDGHDATADFADDRDALGRLFVGPYLALEPDLALVLEDDAGVCGYVLGALDSWAFYARYEREWRPALCHRFPLPDRPRDTWTRAEEVHGWYHEPDYFCPEPYDAWPSHLHIDLVARAQGQGHGRRMIEALLDRLRAAGSPGVHLGVRPDNQRAIGFYAHLGFTSLARRDDGNGASLYMARSLKD